MNNKMLSRFAQMAVSGLIVAAIALVLLIGCKPADIQPPCAPLSIENGFAHVTAVGGKVRLKLPAKVSGSVTMTDDCKYVRGFAATYSWHDGKLIDYSDYKGNDWNVVRISVGDSFNSLENFMNMSLDNPAPSWRYESPVRHKLYPLEFYPHYYWKDSSTPPVKAPRDVVWGVIGTHGALDNRPFEVYCDIARADPNSQASVVDGVFFKDYGDAKCRGWIYAINKGNVISALIDVTPRAVPHIDEIYNTAVEKLQAMIQE